MKNNSGAALGILAAMAILFLVVVSEVSIWNECRTTNSWIYCMKIVGS